jgi:tetratricopeptide (TPR) repeat protein
MLETQPLLTQAVQLHQQGQLVEAGNLYDSVLAIDPHNGDALHLLGLIALQTQQYQSAVELMGQAIHLAPDNALFHCNRGVALKNLGQFQAAIVSYNQAIRLKPDYAEAYNNRGISLKELQLYPDALDSFRQAIGHHPHFAEAYSNSGIVLHRLGQLGAAMDCFNTAIILQPGLGQAYCYRGAVYKDQHQFHAALNDFEQAIALNPLDAEAHSHQSSTLLMLGEFHKGWALYEWRWKNPNFTSDKNRPPKPIWTPKTKQRVLLWAEQGVGDEIMFGTLLADFKGHCTELIVEADERLLPLYQRSMPEGITFVPRQSAVPEHAYDCQISMASLCQYLRNDESFFLQARKAYLKNDSQRTNRIRSELALQPGQLVCGISWHSQNTDIGASKSIALKELIRHLDLPQCQWVNLQYGDMTAEIAKVNAELGVEILQCPSVDNRQDMDGLASLIGACDVIVSISNTTVHLAGALGKKVHVMLPFSADWRWLHNRCDSIWYPDVHLYRQPSAGDWSRVFAQVRDALLIKQESLK